MYINGGNFLKESQKSRPSEDNLDLESELERYVEKGSELYEHIKEESGKWNNLNRLKKEESIFLVHSAESYRRAGDIARHLGELDDAVDFFFKSGKIAEKFLNNYLENLNEFNKIRKVRNFNLKPVPGLEFNDYNKRWYQLSDLSIKSHKEIGKLYGKVEGEVEEKAFKGMKKGVERAIKDNDYEGGKDILSIGFRAALDKEDHIKITILSDLGEDVEKIK